MIRQGLKPILVVLNNDGYTIERMIHGENAKYNDVGAWDWQRLLPFMGAKEGQYGAHRVSTNAELDKLFTDPLFANANKIAMVEVMMDKMDAPRALKEQAEMTAKSNAEK